MSPAVPESDLKLMSLHSDRMKRSQSAWAVARASALPSSPSLKLCDSSAATSLSSAAGRVEIAGPACPECVIV